MQMGQTFKGAALLITWIVNKEIANKGETRLARISHTNSPKVCEKYRLGITITKKYASAVERNRVKRIIREAFRCIASSGLLRSLPIAIDCNIRPRKQGITFAECVQDFQDFFALFAK